MRRLLASLLFCLPLIAHADCKDRLAGWLQTLHPGRHLDADHASCKPWPANPAQTLAVLPIPQKEGDPDSTVYDVEVLLADSNTGAILAHSYEPSAIISDAVSLQGISLDTARYQLSAQQRAFGVRTSYAGSSRVNPYGADTLSLYVVEGAKLRRVLDNLQVHANDGEWDGNCAGHFSDTVRTLALGPAGASGYATLQVAEKTVLTTQKPAGNECPSVDKPGAHASYTLQYEGSAYTVPKALHYAP